MATEKFQATLETVTPLFLGGSDPRGQPELRAASFRGAMRFWLRALLGGILGDRPDKIFERESQVFGSTDHASPVVVQVSHQNLPSIGYSELTQSRAGIAYLFFGARPTRNEPERKAIANGCQFSCTFHLRAGVQNPKILQAVAAALWLLTNLGGLGMRARKGGGNLRVVSADCNDPLLPSLVLQARTPEQLQSALQHGLHRLREWAAEAFGGVARDSVRPNQVCAVSTAPKRVRRGRCCRRLGFRIERFCLVGRPRRHPREPEAKNASPRERKPLAVRVHHAGQSHPKTRA